MFIYFFNIDICIYIYILNTINYLCVYLFIYIILYIANVYFFIFLKNLDQSRGQGPHQIVSSYIKFQICSPPHNFFWNFIYLFFSIFILSLLSHVAIFILFFPCFFFLILSSHRAPSSFPFSLSSSIILISYALNSPRFHQKISKFLWDQGWFFQLLLLISMNLLRNCVVKHVESVMLCILHVFMLFYV